MPGGELRLPQSRGNARVIPIEIGGVLFIRICAEQPEGERRLADLSRTADQDHFLVEGPSDRTRRVKILERQPGQQDPRTRGPVESTLPVG